MEFPHWLRGPLLVDQTESSVQGGEQGSVVDRQGSKYGHDPDHRGD